MSTVNVQDTSPIVNEEPKKKQSGCCGSVVNGILNILHLKKKSMTFL